MSTSDYCKKYFPHCGGRNGAAYFAAYATECKKRGGRMNECGCCRCGRSWPGETNDGAGGETDCPTCRNVAGSCVGPEGVCLPNAECGRGKYCRGRRDRGCKGGGNTDYDCQCQPGCECADKITLCPICPDL